MIAQLRRVSLFAQSAALFVALVFALQVLILVAYFMLVGKPLARASVLDLSALITLSADTWASLPPASRPAYIDKVRAQYHLDMAPAGGSLAGKPSLLPYIDMLQTALRKTTGGRAVTLLSCADASDCYVTDVPTVKGPLRFRFSRERIATNPLLAIAIGLSCSIIIAIAGAWCLARCVSRPLACLADATGRLSHGDMGVKLAEDGPRELARLAGDFNRMTHRLRELMNNRATVLAGVSHDLRTPIARMRMALELARRESDPALLSQMEQYLEDMNQLIGQFLDYSRGIRNAPVSELDVAARLRELTGPLPSGQVTLDVPDTCIAKLPAVPFSRVVQNLLENALRYGAGQPVGVALKDTEGKLVIEVRDGGPGIPAAVREEAFKPFVQLDAGRDSAFGGAGLGLAIVNQICDTYGWQVKLLSRAGGGTLARLTIDLTNR